MDVGWAGPCGVMLKLRDQMNVTEWMKRPEATGKTDATEFGIVSQEEADITWARIVLMRAIEDALESKILSPCYETKHVYRRRRATSQIEAKSLQRCLWSTSGGQIQPLNSDDGGDGGERKQQPRQG